MLLSASPIHGGVVNIVGCIVGRMGGKVVLEVVRHSSDEGVEVVKRSRNWGDNDGGGRRNSEGSCLAAPRDTFKYQEGRCLSMSIGGWMVNFSMGGAGEGLLFPLFHCFCFPLWFEDRP